MLTDPELVHFDPPSRISGSFSSLRKVWRNIIETFPRAAYEERTTRVTTPLLDILFVCDPELIEDILVRRADTFGRDSMMRRAFAPFLGKTSIFLAEGADWRWQRRAAAPIFRNEILLSFVPVFAEMAVRQISRWQGSGDRPIEVSAGMLRTTFDVIVETMLGGSATLDFDRCAQALSDALETASWHHILAIFAAPTWMPFPGQRRANRAHDYFYREIDKVVAARGPNTAPNRGLIDHLMAARDPDTGRAMTNADIVMNLLSFINAGHETTTVALTWTLWLIARSEAVQQRLCDEVRMVAGDEPIAAGHIEQLECCRRAIQESMRLYPPVPVLGRRVKVDTRLGEHDVKASTQIVVPIFALHRHVRLWENPNTFDLDRFAPERAKERARCAYLPFSAGPRVCIGASFAMMEAVVILATLVRAFRFRAVPKFRPKPLARVSLRPEGGIPLFIQRR
jgi:cytochrome P450